MTATVDEPLEDLGRVDDAQMRLERLIADLTDEDVRRPSALPGWSVGHLLSHVARNAESHSHRAEGAVRGEVVEQYPGGFEGRARAIEAGAGRPAAVIIADVHDTAATLRRDWRDVPSDAWTNPTRDVLGRERPLASLVGRRWQELEVHAVDLRLGTTHRDWSDDFVSVWLPRLRSGLAARLPDGAEMTVQLDERDELAWLYGRIHPEGSPTLSPWA